MGLEFWGAQVGVTDKTLARASTVGKPFKAYKPHQLTWTVR